MFDDDDDQPDVDDDMDNLDDAFQEEPMVPGDPYAEALDDPFGNAGPDDSDDGLSPFA